MPGGRHPERRRQRSARVAGAELVVRALTAAQEAREASLLAQRVELVVAAGENLPRISLMADIPDDLVDRRIEGGAQRHRQLHDAEAGPDVAAGLRDDIDQPLPDLVGQLLQLLRRQGLDVLGIVDRLENQFGLVTM